MPSDTKLKVVVICEESGVVREAFRRRGHHAISVDLRPSALPGPHHQGDALEFLFKYADEFDLMIAHPFCTYTAVSGNRHYANTHYRRYGIAFAEAIWHQPIPKRCLEHPVSVLPTSSDIGVKPQYIQPWQFGHGETKRTALFLAGLPPLQPTKMVSGREPRVWTMPPGPERRKLRSRTYQGIAEAMAEQWGGMHFSSRATSRAIDCKLHQRNKQRDSSVDVANSGESRYGHKRKRSSIPANGIF